MKKLLLVFTLVLAFGCASSTSDEEEQVTEVLDKTVRIEISSLQENDAAQISYYDYVNDTDIFNEYLFDYDSSGNAIPVVITLDDYDFRYIRGEVYRKNSIPVQLSLKIYVDDELIIDESKTGNGTDWINISFNYDILKQENI
jgi:hypothetical protein